MPGIATMPYLRMPLLALLTTTPRLAMRFTHTFAWHVFRCLFGFGADGVGSTPTVLDTARRIRYGANAKKRPEPIRSSLSDHFRQQSGSAFSDIQMY